MPPRIENPAAYLMDRIVIGDGCWEWRGSMRPNGYGSVPNARFGTSCSHRAVYELLVGPIPEGMDIDHLCRNRGCARPSHMEPVVHRENLIRGETIAARVRQTHCTHGHEFTPANTRRRKNGTRACLRCEKARGQQRRRLGKLTVSPLA